jgi:riboflavin transporter FmnP
MKGVFMTKTKKICTIAVLTALYVVLGAFLKFNIIGNISVDLGYLAFAVGLCMFGWQATFIGAVGCALESILFSAYGFSVGWFVANIIIGLLCGTVFPTTKSTWLRVICAFAACGLGLFVVKSLIECSLYSIPLAIKMPKSFVAWMTDAVVMSIGVIGYDKYKDIIQIK